MLQKHRSPTVPDLGLTKKDLDLEKVKNIKVSTNTRKRKAEAGTTSLLIDLDKNNQKNTDTTTGNIDKKKNTKTINQKLPRTNPRNLC